MVSLLQAENISKSYGDLVLFEDISLSLHKDQKIAIIAKNGAGKTSLLQIIAGVDNPDEGKIVIRNNISIGYLKQDPQFPDNKTVLEAVFDSSSELIHVLENYNKAIISNDRVLLQEAMEKMDLMKAWDYEVKFKQVLAELKIDNHNELIKNLSGGQKKRIALANVIINEPDILILDEPTNHLDIEMIEWLEEFLIRSKSALLMVTHDRYFLDKVCTDIYELDDRILYHYKGNYSYFLEKRDERIYNYNSEIDKARNLLRKELEWMRRMPKARATKAKSRIDSFYELEEKAAGKKADKKVRLDIKTNRLGKKILSIHYLNKSYGENQLIKDFTYSFVRDEKIGIIGNNGTGKTTLLNIICGELKADSGRFEVGETVVFGYYKQEGIKFKDDQKVIDVVKEIAEIVTLSDGKKFTASQMLQYFLFSGEMQHSRIEKLSGGEKRRLYLLTVLMKNPNFLILDEPTNDLDIMTLQVLEDYLQNFPGCLIVVSHDRFFMDKIVDHIFAFQGNAVIKDFPGNYTQYRSNKQIVRTSVKKDEKALNPNKSKKPVDYSGKLSFKEKFELQQIENQLFEMEEERKSLEITLNSGNLSGEDLISSSKRFAELIEIIRCKEDRWIELNEKIESE